MPGVMSETVSLSVCDTLPSTFEQMRSAMREDLAGSASRGAPRIPDFMWAVIADKATDAVRGALDVDAFGLLAHAWCKARELQEIAGREHAPGTTTVVHLGEHPVVVTLHPVVTVSVGPWQHAVRFTLELTSLFGFAVLTVRDAHITRVDAADCTVSAQLKYGDCTLHKKLDSRRLTLPLGRDLTAPGLAIWRPGGHSA